VSDFSIIRVVQKKVPWDPHLGAWNMNRLALAFSPNGKLLVAGGNESVIKIWEVSNGKLLRTIEGHYSTVTSISFSPDGRVLASAASDLLSKHDYGDSSVRLWRVSDGRLIRTYGGLRNDVWSLIFSPKGRFLAVYGGETIRLWRVSDARLVRTIKGSSIYFSPGGELLAVTTDKTLKLWRVSDNRLIMTLQGGSPVAFSPDGKFLASESKDGAINLWRVSDGKRVGTLKGFKHRVNHLVFSPDGVLLAGVTRETIKLWRVSDARLVRTIKGSSICFSPGGELLAVTTDKTLKLWRISDSRPVSTLKARGRVIHHATFSPDGNLVVGSYGGYRDHGDFIRLWRVSDGKVVNDLEMKEIGEYQSVLFSPDGQVLASVPSWCEAVKWSHAGIFYLWRISDGALIDVPREHDFWVTSLAFSPDGRLLASGSYMDNIIKIWEREFANGSVKFKPVLTIAGFNNGEGVAFTPDGYYSSSPEGPSFVSWTFSGGLGLEAFSFEQFASHFERPEIIKARLSGNRHAGKPAPVITRPPYVDMPEHLRLKETGDKEYALRLTASGLDKVERVRIFVNGNPTLEEPVNAKKKEFDLDVPLFPGANRITAIAFDEKGFSSNPKYVDVICKRTDLPKPDLYVFAVGISRYPRLPNEWQLSYADSDAKAVIEAFKRQEGKLFGNVYSKLLINEEATAETIIDVLDALRAMNDKDVTVLFLGGHGIRAEDGTFYFLSHTGSFQDPDKAGLSWDMLGESLSRIKGRVVLLLDACHSGSITTETVVPNDELAQQLRDGGRSGLMVFCASKGRQEALESPDLGGGFGAFAYGLVQTLGLKGNEADLNGNDYVEFMELVDYVSQFVDEQTEGTQTPWLARRELFGDFPVAKVH